MIARAPRFLLAFSSFLQATGAAVHAAAFPRAQAAIAGSNLLPFFGNSSKALWLGDSTTLVLVAVVFGLIAVRPTTATRLVVTLLALIPAAIAVLIYLFLGSFFAGHLLLIAAARIPRRRSASQPSYRRPRLIEGTRRSHRTPPAGTQPAARAARNAP